MLGHELRRLVRREQVPVPCDAVAVGLLRHLDECVEGERCIARWEVVSVCECQCQHA